MGKLTFWRVFWKAKSSSFVLVQKASFWAKNWQSYEKKNIGEANLRQRWDQHLTWSPEVVCDFGALNILTFLDQWNVSSPLYHSVKQQIMAPCCQCKGTGRCLSCFWVKRGLNCTSCHPNRTSRCANQSAQKRPLGLGKGSSQPQLPRNKVNIETTLSQPALPLAVSSAGLPYPGIFLGTIQLAYIRPKLGRSPSPARGVRGRVSHIMLEIFGFNAFSMSRKNHV